MDLSYFEGKTIGVDMRHTVGYALEMFYAEEHLPEPYYPKQEPDPDNAGIFTRLLDRGFSKRFAQDHSYGRSKLPSYLLANHREALPAMQHQQPCLAF